MKKINSHYIQKALIEDIFNTGKDGLLYEYKNGKIQVRKTKKIFSSQELFKTVDDIKDLETKMNIKLESKVIRIFREIEESSDEYIISYADSIIVRRYLIMTFFRINNLHINLEKMIEHVTDASYDIRFEEHGIISDFFFQHSAIKIIDNKNPLYLLDQNIFLGIPFDTSRSNVADIKRRSISFPGFIFPISATKSIYLQNTKLCWSIFDDAFENRKPTFILNVKNSAICFMNKNETINPKGERKKAGNFKIYDPNKEQTPTFEEFQKEIENRDKDKWKYSWKIEKMTNEDFKILFLDNMSKYSSIPVINNDFTLVFKDKIKMLEYVEETLLIEEFVSLNNPSDVSYWSSTEELKYKHKIWELLTPKLITELTKIKVSLK